MLFGFILVLIGVLILAQNLGWSGFIARWWPLLLIVVGVKMMVDHYMSKKAIEKAKK